MLYITMSLPSFKFTNIGVPTNNERVNSGMSSVSKMDKTGILSSITEKAQDTFKDVRLPDISIDRDSSINSDTDTDNLLSFTSLIKIILVIVILWFMWTSLSKNDDFYLGMGQVGHNLQNFLKTMEKKGREVISRITNQPFDEDNSSNNESSSDSDSDSDEESKLRNSNKKQKQMVSRVNPATHQAPIPPSMSNSSNKTPGFIHDESKYTFLDKANKKYTGPSPRADDTTSVTQKQQSGKAGYCYIGEDRGFRSCVRVEAGDKCMSGEVFNRHDICVNPTLRE